MVLLVDGGKRTGFVFRVSLIPGELRRYLNPAKGGVGMAAIELHVDEEVVIAPGALKVGAYNAVRHPDGTSEPLRLVGPFEYVAVQ